MNQTKKAYSAKKCGPAKTFFGQKSGPAKTFFGQKSGPAIAEPAIPPPKALKLEYESLTYLCTCHIPVTSPPKLEAIVLNSICFREGVCDKLSFSVSLSFTSSM